MENVTNTVSVLNDLIEINNDRVAGFEKALADINDENIDLKALFQTYTAQSRKFSQELTVLSAQHGGDGETGNSIAGTLHRAWIDVKALFGGSDRESILNEAERGEDAIKAAYRQAIAGGSLTADTLDTVTTQASEINDAHDKNKALRDLSK